MSAEYEMELSTAMLVTRPVPEWGAESGADGQWHNPACLAMPVEEALNKLPDLCREQFEHNMDILQEQILDRLYSVLREESVTLDERLAIVVNAAGEVDVPEHSQRAAVLRALERNPDIPRQLQTMAALCLAARGVEDVELARNMLKGACRDRQALFQACLKGGLSHFHLLSRN